MHEQAKTCEQACDLVREHRPLATLTAEGVRFAARAFSPTTAGTDGLPPKTVAVLSEELLESFASTGNLWTEQGVWPSHGQTVHIALIPKQACRRRVSNWLTQEHQKGSVQSGSMGWAEVV